MKDQLQQKKLLIISHDKIGSSMAGPGIRYHYMAETLSKDFDVTVGFFDPTYLPDKDFVHAYSVAHIDAHTFESGFTSKDIVIALWLSESMIDYCNRNGIFIVFDLYAPVPVENLAGSLFNGKSVRPEDDFEYERSLDMYRKFFQNGDLFLLSNPRQLDYWTGYVFGADQIRPSTYPSRPIYDRFIFAPMGIDTGTKLEHTQKVIKGVMPGIKETDKVLLWTGGIWGWYDGKILMRAMKRLADKRPDIKLVFFGTQHPNPNVPEMKESFETRELAKELGIIDKTVFFKDGWVPYHERINYLLEGDVAINTHKISIETEFSHRTRVLDHILAELPTISTRGDFLSDVAIDLDGLGIIVPENDEEALVNAIVDIIEPTTYERIKNNIALKRPSYDWSETQKLVKNYLLKNPARLQQLHTQPVAPERSKAYKLAKKHTPITIKKMAIRARKYVKK